MLVHDLTVMPTHILGAVLWACAGLPVTYVAAQLVPAADRAAPFVAGTTAPQATDALLYDGSVRALREEVWAIGPGELARATAALGAPRILVMGPELAEQGP